MADNRPEDYEAMGKPRIFSGKFSEKNVRFMNFVDEQSDDEAYDPQAALDRNPAVYVSGAEVVEREPEGEGTAG